MAPRSGMGKPDAAMLDVPPVTGGEATGQVDSFAGSPKGGGIDGEPRSPHQRQTPDLTAVDYQWNPPPAYPILGREHGWTGEVGLRVLVGSDGSAKEIRIVSSSGHPTLDESAVLAVKTWRFVPATESSRPVPSWVRVPVVFQLEH